MAHKDPEQRREYQKQLMRERRARAKRGQPASARAATGRAKAVGSVTTTRTVYDDSTESIELVERLEQYDRKNLDLAEALLEKAQEALQWIDTQKLQVVDIKRMVEVSLKLKSHAAEKLTKEEERTQQAIFVTEDVIGDPGFLDAAHAMLTYSAADDLAQYVDGSAARPADSRILRALHESTGVDPVPPSSPS